MPIPAQHASKLRALRAEFDRAAFDRPSAEWRKLELDVRCIIIMLAGLDPQGDDDLAVLARREWREFALPERDAIASAAERVRWQLNGARSISTATAAHVWRKPMKVQ